MVGLLHCATSRATSKWSSRVVDWPQLLWCYCAVCCAVCCRASGLHEGTVEGRWVCPLPLPFPLE